MIPQYGKMYSIKEAAAMLWVGRDSVVRLILRGKLKCVEFPQMGGRGKNKKRMIPEAELDRFFRDNCNGFLMSV
jgi:excisionase family DNA binding protein